MSRKHVPDLMVCKAYLIAATMKRRWPTDILVDMSGECPKVCYRAMERAARHGLIKWGNSLRSGWLTQAGRELVGLEAPKANVSP